jgi:uncharacterized cysteine cluster protein YcgN (CxxCxxCC family)
MPDANKCEPLHPHWSSTQSGEYFVVSFWETKRLDELNPLEWESLCDGCGRCCLVKLEDEDTSDVYYTDVACRLLDTKTCRCSHYADRTKLVADCVRLDPNDLDALKWMPTTCAYRIVHEHRPLPDWHPLVSGRSESVHEAGISVRDKCTSEQFIGADDLRERLVSWVKTRA